MAISKYWYEEYGAVPGTFTSDQLEYELPAPVPKTEQWKPQYSNMLSVRIWTRAVTA